MCRRPAPARTISPPPCNAREGQTHERITTARAAALTWRTRLFIYRRSLGFLFSDDDAAARQFLEERERLETGVGRHDACARGLAPRELLRADRGRDARHARRRRRAPLGARRVTRRVLEAPRRAAPPPRDFDV